MVFVDWGSELATRPPWVTFEMAFILVASGYLATGIGAAMRGLFVVGCSGYLIRLAGHSGR
jgi:hypothetical protein